MAVSAHVEGQILPAVPLPALAHRHSSAPLPSSEMIHSSPSADLTRSASYTYLPTLEKETSNPPIKRTFSENVLSLLPESKTKVNDSVHMANMELFRRASRKAKRKMSSAKFSMSGDEEETLAREMGKVGVGKDEQPKSLSRSVAGTLRTFARKSWAAPSPSRPSSPVRRDDSALPERKRSWSPSKNKTTSVVSSIGVPEPVAARSPSPSHRKTRDKNPTAIQRPLSVLYVKNKSELSLRRLSRNSSSTSLKSSASNERLQSKISSGRVPPLPTTLSSDRLAAIGAEVTRRKDPLWTAFRGLDGEFVSFQTRPSLQKAKVLRLTLMPFLVKYAQHPSNHTLRAEDLDRRVNILNKWWTALLEMLHGSNNQTITGTDRPSFLESASMIMLRPEWRAPGFATTGDTPRRSSIPKSKSTNSLESDGADFLIDTIHQNVRNIFVQNLLSQMAFVIDKLSLRAAPASLVAFAGKTCAFAFFFCPGVADMLTRLWRLSPGTLRRVFNELGVEQGDKLDLISQALANHFPPPVRSLCVGSQAGLSRHLQQRSAIPPGSESVRWSGPWVGRWSGRDSDLFFSFTKHYHILVSEFLPEDISLRARAGIPGLVPLCAQSLVVLETTIYRQGNQNADPYPSGTGYNMDNPDALASLPMVMANASRSIAENRLIILLRDVLGDIDPDRALFRNLFVGSFDSVTKAATRKISLYNNDACYVICDFMEEVLPIMVRYHQNDNDTPILDWPFWLEVCKRMMQSQSVLTQIRLIAFVYSTWSILIFNEERKRQLVLEWLLDPGVFEQHFCHWSPMVRHYFYRLLCWRIARYDGQVSDLDVEILRTLATRLNKCWANYQYLSAEAEMRGLVPPPSAPCSPAPSRVLIIIRTDSQPVFTNPATTYDKYPAAAVVTQSSPYQNHSSVLNTIPSADSPTPGTKKRWSLFRGLNVFGSSPGNNRPGEVTPPGSPEENGVVTASDHSPGPNSAITANKPSYRPATPPHQAFSFKFSLEWYQKAPTWENKNRVLTAPQLPPNAQSILRARLSSESTSTGSSVSGDAKGKARAKEVTPLKPQPHEMGTARYSGRALAEWAQVLNECRSFYMRRKQEGVPRDHLVETPTMAVEAFRLMS
ncbi:uncharacterized protein Z518_07074 [Rhinocladiella mackenziei CBS 650.93]|uniref:Rhinocladiella mackenziei CBS 650.93 unplaced genomic scaffold supercont1.5, whole genome shotgun sequence n=1 Tax=Rhinocladiella mackenziei CBS 650.93 TaxID=1442369 RepID=A0A0D2IJY8_9EURO|nr:uncharacterized protein Z518_07074 [Rhinocladiella mackenziei CBS 650.93]KIX03521.1 hypothetical protein Z518_07074 [Rhinocladiella mackenziei CBS 650.93]